MVQVGSTIIQAFDVPNAGIRRNDDPGTGQVRSPAEIDVVPVERDGGVEAAERTKQVGSDEHASRRQHEHVTDGVVLLLIGLTRVDDRVDLTEAIEAEADVLQHLRVVPFGQFGSDHAGVRSEQLGNQQPHHVGGQGDVVVADEKEPVVAVDQSEHIVHGGAETWVADDGANEGGRDDPTDTSSQRIVLVVVGVRHEEQCSQVGVVLRGQRVEGLVEPVAGFMHDHDGDDRRRELGVGLHDPSRLAAAKVDSRSLMIPQGDADHTQTCQISSRTLAIASSLWHTCKYTWSPDPAPSEIRMDHQREGTDHDQLERPQELRPQ